MSDDTTCIRCGEEYQVRDGMEPTPHCDLCAHVVLSCLRTWLAAERSRREAHSRRLAGKGGQEVGDSHCPRLPISVLLELERMVLR